MKISRALSGVAALALVASSTLLFGQTAMAADYDLNPAVPVPFPAETNPYAADWFTGGGSIGSQAYTADGLVLDATAGLVQILNGNTPTTGLAALADGADIDVAAGATPFFQIPVFTISDGGYTTLRPVVPGATASTDEWITTGAISTGKPTSFVANSSAPLTDLIAAMADDYRILAFGAFAPIGTTSTIASITFAGDTFNFVPAAVAPEGPAPTPGLPVTGAEATPAIIAAGVFLLLGAGLTFVVARRRTATQR